MAAAVRHYIHVQLSSNISYLRVLKNVSTHGLSTPMAICTTLMVRDGNRAVCVLQATALIVDRIRHLLCRHFLYLRHLNIRKVGTHPPPPLCHYEIPLL